jgi:hypothetical protein
MYQIWVVCAGTAGTAYNTRIILYFFQENFGKWTPFVMAKCTSDPAVALPCHRDADRRRSVLWVRAAGVGWWAIFDTITVIPVQVSV